MEVLLKLTPPKVAPEIPSRGFAYVTETYVPPASDPDNISVVIRKDSERLQRLERFSAWNGMDFEDLVILAKVVEVVRPTIYLRQAHGLCIEGT